MKKIYKKITTGFVTQTFEDGVLTDQDFEAGDDVEYEDESGEAVDIFDDDISDDIENLTASFHMVSSGKSIYEIREKIQQDILTHHDDLNQKRLDHICQIVVDNFKNKI